MWLLPEEPGMAVNLQQVDRAVGNIHCPWSYSRQLLTWIRQAALNPVPGTGGRSAFRGWDKWWWRTEGRSGFQGWDTTWSGIEGCWLSRAGTRWVRRHEGRFAGWFHVRICHLKNVPVLYGWQLFQHVYWLIVHVSHLKIRSKSAQYWLQQFPS